MYKYKSVKKETEFTDKDIEEIEKDGWIILNITSKRKTIHVKKIIN